MPRDSYERRERSRRHRRRRHREERQRDEECAYNSDDTVIFYSSESEDEEPPIPRGRCRPFRCFQRDCLLPFVRDMAILAILVWYLGSSYMDKHKDAFSTWNNYIQGMTPMVRNLTEEAVAHVRHFHNRHALGRNHTT